MCEQCCEDYNVFPAVTFGGPGGDYTIDCPIESCRWAEYRILSLTCGSGGAANVYISGNEVEPIQPVYDGSKTLSDDTFLRGLAYRIPKDEVTVANTPWQRVTNSMNRVSARIDTFDSCYIIIQFRVKMLTIIPGPAEATHPDLGQQMNIQRAENIRQRLAQAGIPERAIQNA